MKTETKKEATWYAWYGLRLLLYVMTVYVVFRLSDDSWLTVTATSFVVAYMISNQFIYGWYIKYKMEAEG